VKAVSVHAQGIPINEMIGAERWIRREKMVAQFFSLHPTFILSKQHRAAAGSTVFLRVLAVAVLVVVSSSNHCCRYVRSTSRTRNQQTCSNICRILIETPHTCTRSFSLSRTHTDRSLTPSRIHTHTPTYTPYTHSNIHAFGTGALHVGGLGRSSTTCGWIGRVGRSDTLIPPVLVLRESASCQ